MIIGLLTYKLILFLYCQSLYFFTIYGQRLKGQIWRKYKNSYISGRRQYICTHTHIAGYYTEMVISQGQTFVKNMPAFLSTKSCYNVRLYGQTAGQDKIRICCLDPWAMMIDWQNALNYAPYCSSFLDHTTVNQVQ